MAPLTIGLTEARQRLSEVADEVNRTKRTVIVLKNNRPWVSISPVSQEASDTTPAIQDALEAFRSMRSEAASKGFATEADINSAISDTRRQRAKS